MLLTTFAAESLLTCDVSLCGLASEPTELCWPEQAVTDVRARTTPAKDRLERKDRLVIEELHGGAQGTGAFRLTTAP
jgi:hypothetical protein